MLDANLTAQLTGLLKENLRENVELRARLDDGPTSARIRELLDELAALSDRISVADDPNPESRVPSFTIARPGTEVAVSFAALPMGHEFNSLVLALLQVGGHPGRVSPEQVEQIQALEGEHHFETFMSLSCQNCPDVVQALNLISILNPRIRHTAIDGALFTEEASRRQVLAVPTVFMDGHVFGQGRMTLPEIVARLDSGAAARETERIAALAPYDVLVVGGGPAPRPPCTPPARESGPGSSLNGSVGRCWTRWRLRT